MNSNLVSYAKQSPYHSGQRDHKIDRITPHCVVGQTTVERLGDIFSGRRQVSANYGIGQDGRIGLYVDEKDSSWCSSSRENDQRAVTIECASDSTHPYAFREIVYESLINLCEDICRRNGTTKLLWINNKARALNYEPKEDEMILTVHRWFARKACPGEWLFSRLSDLANKVTARLGENTVVKIPIKHKIDNEEVPIRVKVLSDDLKINKTASNDMPIQSIQKGVYTIVELKNGFGKLKSGAGWINISDSKQIKIIKSDTKYQINVGNFDNRSTAESALIKIKSIGFNDAFIVKKLI